MITNGRYLSFTKDLGTILGGVDYYNDYFYVSDIVGDWLRRYDSSFNLKETIVSGTEFDGVSTANGNIYAFSNGIGTGTVYMYNISYGSPLDINYLNLSSGSISKGDEFVVSCSFFDKNSTTTWTNSSTLTISNSVPVFTQSNLEFEISHNYNISLPINATDADTDTLTYAVNDTGFTINSSTGLLNRSNDVDDIGFYNITVNVTDGDDTVSMWLYYEINNTKPTVDAVGFDYSNWNITVTSEISDLDNDAITDYSRRWFLNGAYHAPYNNQTSVNTSGFGGGTNISVELIVYDGLLWSDAVMSANATVGDSQAPSIFNCTVSDTSVYQNTVVDFCCNVTDNNQIALGSPKFEIIDPNDAVFNYSYSSNTGNEYCKSLSMGTVGTYTYDNTYAYDGVGNLNKTVNYVSVFVQSIPATGGGGGGASGGSIDECGLQILKPTKKFIQFIGGQDEQLRNQIRLFNNQSNSHTISFDLGPKLSDICTVSVNDYSLPGSSEVSVFLACNVPDTMDRDDIIEDKLYIFYGTACSDSIDVSIRKTSVQAFLEILSNIYQGKGGFWLYLSILIIPTSLLVLFAVFLGKYPTKNVR
jgi:hypothetical protein